MPKTNADTPQSEPLSPLKTSFSFSMDVESGRSDRLHPQEAEQLLMACQTHQAMLMQSTLVKRLVRLAIDGQDALDNWAAREDALLSHFGAK